MISSFSDPNIRTESQNVSYWLEKLFNQEEDKAKGIRPQQIYLDTKIEQTLEEKGLETAVRSHANKAERDRQAVEDMVNNSNRVLLRASSVFPWDFFPSSIVVEETRITIITRQLFSSQLHSVDIKNISNVFIANGILFAQLAIVSNTFTENQIIINRVWKKDAILIRRLIEGLRMFVAHDIDTTGYKVEELISKLKELSTAGMII